jgi:hypothetical protein
VDRSPPAFHRPPEDDLLLTNRASSTEVAQFPDLFIKLPKQLDSDADKGWRSAETARVLLATVPHPKVPRRPTSHNPTEASLQSAVLMRSSGPEGPSLRTRGAARVAAPKYDNRPTKIDPNEHPRLQGFPPHEDPLPRTGGLDRYEARCSLGFSALQGIPPLPRWPGLHRASPHGLRSQGAETTFEWPSRVSLPGEMGIVSLETAYPHGLRRLMTSHERLKKTAVRESPPQAPGCVTVPCRTLFEPSILLGRSRS